MDEKYHGYTHPICFNYRTAFQSKVNATHRHPIIRPPATCVVGRSLDYYSMTADYVEKLSSCFDAGEFFV